MSELQLKAADDEKLRDQLSSAICLLVRVAHFQAQQNCASLGSKSEHLMSGQGCSGLCHGVLQVWQFMATHYLACSFSSCVSSLLTLYSLVI